MPDAGAPMIFVSGLWTFLRALFVEPAAVALENLALRHQLLVLQRSSPDPGSPIGIGSSGSGCPASGRVGATTSSSFNPPPSSPGTAEGSGSTGDGGPGPVVSEYSAEPLPHIRSGVRLDRIGL